MAVVLWRDAQGKEGSVELGAQEIHIGRAVDCAIRTDDAMVSRHHARLYWSGGKYFVEDLGSANGMFYQEQRVSRHALNHGDAVRCGSLWLRFVDAPRDDRPVDPLPDQPNGSSEHGPMGANDAEEIRRLRRRVDQLQSELRIYRSGSGADAVQKIEDLENENDQLEEQVVRLKSKVQQLEDVLAEQGADVKLRRADEVVSKTSEVVQQLNDVLSNLRINVMAAEGEFEQFSHQLPRASFELIREALRSSSGDVDAARELLRTLRDLAD